MADQVYSCEVLRTTGPRKQNINTLTNKNSTYIENWMAKYFLYIGVRMCVTINMSDHISIHIPY